MAGFGWPLDGVQAWFEGFWNWVSTAAVNAVAVVNDWIWSAIYWIRDRVNEGLEWLKENVWGFFSGAWEDIWRTLYKFAGEGLDLVWSVVKDLPFPWRDILQFLLAPFAFAYVALKPLIFWVWDQILPLLTAINDGLSYIAGAVIAALPQPLKDFIGWMGDLGRALWDSLAAFAKDPVGTLKAGWATVTSAVSKGLGDLWAGAQEWGSNALGSITTMFDGAVASIGGWVSDALAGVAKALGEGLRTVLTWLGEKAFELTEAFLKFVTEKAIEPLWEMMIPFGGWIREKVSALLAPLIEKVTAGVTGKPEEVLDGAIGLVTSALAIAGTVEMFDFTLGAVKGIAQMGSHSSISTWIQPLIIGTVAGGVLSTIVGQSVLTPVRYAINEMMTPIIPGPGDLIRFVVREVIPPETFYELMPKHGYSSEIAKWFWDAHFVLPAFSQLVDAFHRGVITDSELDTFIFWHDYSPTARPGIGKSDVKIMRGLLKRLIPRVDLRYAWEMGKLTDTELEDRYVKLGYEEDAALMTEIQMARALVEEVHKVRDEWIRDFLEGYILEGTLRANLAAIGIGPLRVDYYVEYAKMRREREYTADLLDAYWDGYLKDLVTQEDLETFARQEIVVPEMAELWIRRAYVRKYKKPKEVTPPEAKKLPVSDLRRAFREELISEEMLRAELAERDYAAADIDVIIAIETEKMVG